jgi:peroxiredoxin Q/BCP
MGKKPGRGDKAPEFQLPDDREKPRTLKSYAGHKLVLYFYPKDDTSGCTKEAVDFSALKGEFEKADTAILGVSPAIITLA